MAKGVLVDLTRCIGCRGCQVACKAWNERGVKRTTMSGDYTNPPTMNSECYTNIRFVESDTGARPVWAFVKDQCMHCEKPACASVCPVKALHKTDAGPVVYDSARCIGCRYCMMACPFQVPKYEWEKTFPLVRKCTFCADRIQEGQVPACVKTCPTGTMLYGEREQIVAEAERRISSGRGTYVDHIYGREEAGGTSWVYISREPFERLGFNMNVPQQVLPDLTWAYISGIPTVIGVVLVGGVGSWFFTRRNEVQEKEGPR